MTPSHHLANKLNKREREARRCFRSFGYIGLMRAAEWRVQGHLHNAREMVRSAKHHRLAAPTQGHWLP